MVPIIGAMTFGLYPACIQAAYAEGANVSFVVITTTFFRALTLAIFCLLTSKSILPRPGDLRPFLSGGFCQALSIIGILGSLMFLPGPVTVILMFTHTIMLLFYMAYRGEIRLSTLAVLSTLCALFGVSLVVDVWHHLHNLPWIGVGLAMMSAFATLTRLYVFGKQTQHTNPAVVGAQTFLMATVCTLPLAFFMAPLPPQSWLGIAALSGSCLSLALGTFAMFYGIWLVGSFQFSLMAKLEPVFTAIFSFLILGQVLNFWQYIGMALVIGSLVAYQYFEQRPEAASV